MKKFLGPDPSDQNSPNGALVQAIKAAEKMLKTASKEPQRSCFYSYLHNDEGYKVFVALRTHSGIKFNPTKLDSFLTRIPEGIAVLTHNPPLTPLNKKDLNVKTSLSERGFEDEFEKFSMFATD